MNTIEQKKRAKEFAKKWLTPGAGENERGETETFWKELYKIFGVSDDDLGNREKFAREKELDVREKEREDGTKKQTQNSIDVFISLSESNRIFVEQKQRGFPLLKENDNGETPFEQALRYYKWWDEGNPPRWIITCNFLEFWIYDLNKYKKTKRGKDPSLTVPLKDLPQKLHKLAGVLMAGVNTNTSVDDDLHDESAIRARQAGKIVSRIYDSLLNSTKNPKNEETLRSLNIFCVRLVFCLYAENAELFGPKQSEFRDYLKAKENVENPRRALIDLFKILNTPEAKRDPYLKDSVAAFPYVNGGLFSDTDTEVPLIDEATRNIILSASADFDWSKIEPSVFGGVFESTLDPKTRHNGGMHYTSPANIHKVIDPLFLDDLKTELNDIERARISEKERARELFNFQEKLASLKFLDPACGSGNFLTETYLELRELENRAIKSRMKDVAAGQRLLGGEVENPVRVSISQFYGIEINDFAVSVAKTAMWIAECKMLKETEKIISREINFLPLASYANIAEGNALKMDWARLEAIEDLSHFAQRQAEGRELREPVSYDYIFGNPPFVGYSYQTGEQKAEMHSIWRDEQDKPYNMAGRLDYVTAWFFKAANLMKGTQTRSAFVATNSISQGEQVAAVWETLRERFGIHIDFARRTFKWSSESSDMAQVHCIVVGFSSAPPNDEKPRIIFDGDTQIIANNINGYLKDSSDIFVKRISEPISEVPEMVYGSTPRDGGHLIVKARDYADFIKRDPKAKKFLRRYLGANEFLYGEERWCLWLVDATPHELKEMPLVQKRIKETYDSRKASKRKATNVAKERPALFADIRQPKSDYLAIPEVSSGGRRYIPMGFLSSDVICSNKLHVLPGATLFHFGVLTSDVHMAWMRSVCGRLKSDYSYSSLIYNSFPWPDAGEKERAKIEETAQGILNARALYPDSTLADLYPALSMKEELSKAHKANNEAVRKLFGLSSKTKEAEIVQELFLRYSELVKKKQAEKQKHRKAR